MSLPLYQVPRNFEAQAEKLVKANDYDLRLTKERRIPQENDVIERCWSIFQQDKEIFSFAIAEAKNGTLFFMRGPQKESGHKLILRALLEEVEKTGNRIKRGDKTWFDL